MDASVYQAAYGVMQAYIGLAMIVARVITFCKDSTDVQFLSVPRTKIEAGPLIMTWLICPETDSFSPRAFRGNAIQTYYLSQQ